MDLEINVNKYLDDIIQWAIEFLPKLGLAIIILLVGWFVIKRIKKLLNIAIERSSIDNEISSFLQSLLGIILNVLLVFIVIPILGFEISALIGILAAVGFAIGLALQGFLGNFDSGLTIIFFKPYRVGDWVEISESFGQVKDIQIFNTILVTPGKKTLVIPNGHVTDNIITNFSTEGRIKLEVAIPVGYEHSFPKIKNIIEEALRNVDYILPEPEPQIGIESYDSHNIIVTVRPFIDPENYWEATFDVNESIKTAMSRHGITMTYSEGIENGPIGE